MTTTGELKAIIEDLELVDIGEAESYLDEESTPQEDFPAVEPLVLTNLRAFSRRDYIYAAM